ncbi:Acyl-CoA dehydrogenase; probable dibenzothiophene desulfurization enzyme [plant metagenome]|uniref:Acyl-CoA dehydrogenase probable dibenzothiophene desulfurization enzyme n=1 Tax=plant metagenome TaxID=1297885 RepID=A0A484Q8K0_9ZZZZ
MTVIDPPPPGPLPRPPQPDQVQRIRDDAHALATAHTLAAIYAQDDSERDRARRLPWEELERYTRSGLGGITVPRAHGGADVSFATLAEVFVILSAADASLGQIPQNQFGVLALLREAGTPAQQQRFFADVLAGHRIGNAGPERRSKTITTVTTRLRRTPDGLRLDGERFYSTGALFAHWIPTRALDDEGRAVQVWARRDAPGVAVIDDWSAFGQRTTASGSVRFTDVPIDEDAVLPVWQLADRPGLFGPTSQLIQAAIDAGIARASLAAATAFVRQHARPWVDSGLARATDDPYLIQEVGRLQIDLHAAEETLYEAGRNLDSLRGRSLSAQESAQASVDVAVAKVLTTDVALAASEKLFELAGSAATRAAHNLDRHWRNARVHTLHDPVRWKRHAIGNFELNGIAPARHQWN